jgi:uncharacterized protein YndB with AHSA1/START domain
MPDILHRVGADAPAQRVYQALTTIDGLRGWWVEETSGDPRVGGTINFGFCDMQVLESVPDRLVHWRCVRGPQEWVGTEVTFELTQEKDGQTFVLFKHSGWKEPVAFMHHCSTKWATFLLSLRDLLEGSKARPYPHDVKIHVGD